MTWVKVCGLTDQTDVAAAVRAGADAVGFVSIPSSPRFVSLELAAELAAGLPVPSVLLTLDLEPGEALQVLRQTGLGGIQPYGRGAATVALATAEAGYLVLFPQEAAAGIDLGGLPGIPLLDTPSTTVLGGTGRTFDWDLVAGVEQRFVLAGGLGPNNIAAALAQVQPWGVDASSGLEVSPGRKDHGMVADFITKAKNK